MSELPSTSPPAVPADRLRRARLIRRIALATIALFALVGALGFLGIRTRTATGGGGGYTMRLEYPWTDRSDQPIHWVLTVAHPGGFSGPVDIGITQSYLDLLDVNDIEPAPSATHSSPPFVVWTFDPPAGDVLTVSLDANIQLNAHFGAAAEVAVLEGGRIMASVHYRTWVAP